VWNGVFECILKLKCAMCQSREWHFKVLTRFQLWNWVKWKEWLCCVFYSFSNSSAWPKKNKSEGRRFEVPKFNEFDWMESWIFFVRFPFFEFFCSLSIFLTKKAQQKSKFFFFFQNLMTEINTCNFKYFLSENNSKR
jgi:hypothetical protein